MNNHIPPSLEKIYHSPWSFFLKNFRITLVLIVVILIVGLQSALTIPQEVNPDVNIPTAIVSTFYQGASPEDIEKLITNKLETRIASLEDIDEITSVSQEGFSNIVVNFEAKSNMDDNMDRLREAVDKVTDLPDDVTGPDVQEVSVSDTPIITFSFLGPFNEDTLKAYGEIIEENVQSVPGISEVVTSGIRDKEFHVLLKQDQLRQYGITTGEVIQMIQQEHINSPIGTITLDTTRYPVRLSATLDTVEALRELPLRAENGGFLYLKDIASIEEDFTKTSVLARVSSLGQSSEPSVSLALFKKSGGNTIKIIEDAKSAVEALYTEGTLPSALLFETTNDTSEFIREDLDTLINSGIQTVILIAILLFIVLGLKEALIASFSIPLVFCISMFALNQIGLTLNGITLFSLVLSLGLLVDTSIIMLEGFHEQHIIHGKPSLESALHSIKTYRWPLISGTLTTIAAFIPMLLVSGILGEFLKSIPLTILFTLSSSLFVALFISPTLCFLLYKRSKSTHKKVAKAQTKKGLMPILKRNYERFLAGVIKRRLLRWSIILIAIIAFIASMALPITGLLGVQMFPPVNVNYFTINIEAPQGTSLEETYAITKEVENILLEEPLIKNFVLTVGSGAASRSSVISSPGGGGGQTHIAGISVNLIDKKEREVTSSEVIKQLRTKFSTITTAEVQITEAQAGPPTGAPIEIRLTGPSLVILNELATRVENELKNINGTVEVKNDIQTGTGEFSLRLDREVARALGIRASDLTLTLRSAVFGITATTVQVNGEDQDIIVQYVWDSTGLNNELQSLEALENIEIPTPSGERVPLSIIADVELGVSYTAINHYEEERIVRVQAQTEGRPVIEIVEELKEKLIDVEIPQEYTISFGGENEDTQESFSELFSSMIIAVILIALILILQFNSFIQPLIIMFSVPLALIGVLGGLTLFGLYLSFPAFIGVVSLAGIVVNDAIVLIDRINSNRSEGMALEEAIVEGTMARMQPIFLTSVTTIVGLIPLSLSDPVWGGLGFSIIFGLSFATILILLIIPILYRMMEGRGERKRLQNQTLAT